MSRIAQCANINARVKLKVEIRCVVCIYLLLKSVFRLNVIALFTKHQRLSLHAPRLPDPCPSMHFYAVAAAILFFSLALVSFISSSITLLN